MGSSGVYGYFSIGYHFFISIWQTALYGRNYMYCFKGPLNSKQLTDQSPTKIYLDEII